MQMLMRAFIIVAVIVALLISFGFLLSPTYSVCRSINIDAPAEAIYPHIADFKKWQIWGVWFQRDQNMSISHSGPEKAVGMTIKWQSETQGSGEMTVTDLAHNEKVVYDLYFPEMDTRSTGTFVIKALQSGSEVTWCDSGNVGLNPLYRYLTLFLDGMLGPDFELGLGNLKTVAENT